MSRYHHTPLRLFMGLQMIGWGAVIDRRNPWALTQNFDTGWLWPVIIVAAGGWLALTALCEIYTHKCWPQTWTEAQRVVYRLLLRYTTIGYFFGGAVWGGIATHAMYRGDFREVDFLCPLYMMFLLFLAFNDASKKRKGVESNNENKRKTAAASALFHDSLVAGTGLSTERVRG